MPDRARVSSSGARQLTSTLSASAEGQRLRQVGVGELGLRQARETRKFAHQTSQCADFFFHDFERRLQDAPVFGVVS